jgi:transcriptional antiterminator RfaH
MNWYLIRTKPRQEQIALQNLMRQGFFCYLPMLTREKLVKGKLDLIDEPLFPRYLFIQLDVGASAKSWSPIRSTRGVTELVSFGVEPAKVEDGLIAELKIREQEAREHPRGFFTPGEQLRITQGPFANVDAIFQIADGSSRVRVLIEFMNKTLELKVDSSIVRKHPFSSEKK